MLEFGSGEAEGDLVRFTFPSPPSPISLCHPPSSDTPLFRVVCRDDCEGSDTGSLDVDAFVKAMWRIDEELRKARLNPSSFGPNSGCGSPSRRQPRRIGSFLR